MSLPFKETQIDENVFIRVFSQTTDVGEFYWHRDREDRRVISTHTTDWMVQLDNELPKSLNEEVFVPIGMWHRVIKGTGDLEVKVIKIF